MKTHETLEYIGNSTINNIAVGLRDQAGVSGKRMSEIAQKFSEFASKEMPDANGAELMAGAIGFLMALALETAEDIEEVAADIEKSN